MIAVRGAGCALRGAIVVRLIQVPDREFSNMSHVTGHSKSQLVTRNSQHSIGTNGNSYTIKLYGSIVTIGSYQAQNSS